MKGATGLDWAKINNRPNSNSTRTIGVSQYFFSSFRNIRNSRMTRDFAMLPYDPWRDLKKVFVMSRVSTACIERRPCRIGARQTQRITAEQAHGAAEWRENNDKECGQQDPRIDPPEHERRPPPRAMRQPQRTWHEPPGQNKHETRRQQRCADALMLQPSRHTGN